MSKIFKKAAEKLKKIVQRGTKFELICSNPCACKDECNKVLILSQANDKQTIEIAIDWAVAKTRPTADENGISVLVPRRFLVDNLLMSGNPMSKIEEFSYALDIFFAKMQKERGLARVKLPTEVNMQELKDWVNKQLKEEYGKE